MDAATNNNQEPQEKKSEGGISQGINAFNNLRGLRNLSGKTGLKTAAQAGRVAATAGKGFMVFLTTPQGWITLTIIAVVVITFIIVLSLGAPPMETNINANQTAIPTPTPPPPVGP